MLERGHRFDDTFWGRTLRFWPLIVAIGGAAFFVDQKLERHETRLTIVELQLEAMQKNLDEMKIDMKTLLRRGHQRTADIADGG